LMVFYHCGAISFLIGATQARTKGFNIACVMTTRRDE
jgi:hypothetical protein